MNLDGFSKVFLESDKFYGEIVGHCSVKPDCYCSGKIIIVLFNPIRDLTFLTSTTISSMTLNQKKRNIAFLLKRKKYL